MKTRRGVTLLEVLIAIGIVSVGILGTMATLIVAGHQASAGISADAIDRLGRSAVDEFTIRGFDRPVGPDGTWAAIPAGLPPHPRPGRSYCLDPSFVASHGSTLPLSWFPAVDAADGGGRLHRVSIRPFPGDQITAPVSPIGAAAAESIFTGMDDLVFARPNDRTLPPEQVYGGGQRQYDGRYSWFATVQHDTGYAVLCIVIFRSRNIAEIDAERLVEVDSLEVGSVTIRPRTTAGGTVRPLSDLDCREGQWLMLVGIDPASGTVPHRWYRVLGAEDIDAGTRYLSVLGLDWGLPAADTRAVLLGSVVAVYEKTIRFK
jgi:prepilin-type N-terminal cleavage/methylation domain-containing protein